MKSCPKEHFVNLIKDKTLHPIQIFESFNWLKRRSHEIDNGFDNSTIIHVSYSRRSCHTWRIWNSIAYFLDITVRYGFLKNLRMEYIKTNIDCSYILWMVEIIVPSVNSPLAYYFYSPHPNGPRWSVGQGWILTWEIIAVNIYTIFNSE